MDQWVAAFVGDSARENYETTLVNGKFWVSSNRTPIRRVEPGDRLLLYVTGEGFVGEAVAASGSFPDEGGAKWAGKTPILGISLRGIRLFSSPIYYKFPEKGTHPILGFHRYALTGGFTTLAKEGLEEIIGQASKQGALPLKFGEPEPPTPETQPEPAEATEVEANARPTARDDGPAESKVRVKHKAGQHAVNEGRKGVVLWTAAETLSQAVGWKGAQKKAREKALGAKNTWLKGGRAEVRVGSELEELREHGFYIFHDVQLPGVGNIDHVALGPRGFFDIETKSHNGRVSAKGRELLLNGRRPDKDFVSQTWRGCYRLKEVFEAEVTPLLCFTDAFVEGRIFVRGVKVVPLDWLNDEILGREVRHESRFVAQAVNALGRTTGSYPSSVPRAQK